MMEKAPLTRRGFLGGAAAASASAAYVVFGGSAVASSPPVVHGPAFAGLRRAEFEKRVGSTFNILAGPNWSTITLASVTALTMAGLPRHKRAGGAKTTGEQYSLFFTDPSSGSFDQGVYSLAAPGLNPFSLLLVPVGPDGAGRGYQAVIVNV
jgi:hypothetical protein